MAKRSRNPRKWDLPNRPAQPAPMPPPTPAPATGIRVSVTETPTITINLAERAWRQLFHFCEFPNQPRIAGPGPPTVSITGRL